MTSLSIIYDSTSLVCCLDCLFVCLCWTKPGECVQLERNPSGWIVASYSYPFAFFRKSARESMCLSLEKEKLVTASRTRKNKWGCPCLLAAVFFILFFFFSFCPSRVEVDLQFLSREDHTICGVKRPLSLCC